MWRTTSHWPSGEGANSHSGRSPAAITAAGLGRFSAARACFTTAIAARELPRDHETISAKHLTMNLDQDVAITRQTFHLDQRPVCLRIAPQNKQLRACSRLETQFEPGCSPQIAGCRHLP